MTDAFDRVTPYTSIVGPAVKPPLPRVKPAPKDEADVRAGFDEAQRGEGVELTKEELERLAEAGEWPERLG